MIKLSLNLAFNPSPTKVFFTKGGHYDPPLEILY